LDLGYRWTRDRFTRAGCAAHQRDFRAVNRRDWDTVLRYWTDDAVLDMSAAGLGEFRDHAAIAPSATSSRNVRNLRMVPEDVRDFGDGVVLVIVAAEAPAPQRPYP
jgi:SnoaL-like domain